MQLKIEGKIVLTSIRQKGLEYIAAFMVPWLKLQSINIFRYMTRFVVPNSLSPHVFEMVPILHSRFCSLPTPQAALPPTHTILSSLLLKEVDISWEGVKVGVSSLLFAFAGIPLIGDVETSERTAW